MDNEPAVYEIDLTKKHILRVARPLSEVELAAFRDHISEWLSNDKPFLILFGDVTLVKVEIADEQ